MVIQISRLIFAFLATFLFNFSAQASDENRTGLTYIPGKYEIARRLKARISADKELVEATLESILQTIKLKQGPDPIIDTADCLQELMNIHADYEVGTPQRNEKLKELDAKAQEIFQAHSKKPPVPREYDFTALIASLQVEPTVKDFITDYFGEIRENKRAILQGAAALGVGVSAGCGFGMSSYLSGSRCPTFCLTAGGIPWGCGATVSLECSQHVSDSCFTSLWRFHFARALDVVRDIRRVDKRAYYFKPDPTSGGYVRGIGVGIADLEVRSAVVDIPLFFPWPSSYSFARERLGITYPVQ